MAETSEQALSFRRCQEAVRDLQPTHPISRQPGLAWVEWVHQTAPWGKTTPEEKLPWTVKEVVAGGGVPRQVNVQGRLALFNQCLQNILG